MIRLDALGGIILRGEDGHPIDRLLRQPKRLAVLAYLGAPAPGTWHRRDVILGLFWPELDAAHARTALRNTLYVIRQSLGEGVLRNRGDEEISVDPDLLTTDVVDLRAALAGGRIDQALSLYRGPLLQGLFVSDAPGFEHWLDGERDRLRREVTEAGSAWAHTLETEGRLGDALAVVRAMVEVCPDDEPLVRRLMILHERLGDPGGGLAAFERYRTWLGAEFEANPAEETVAVAERLRGGEVGSPAGAARKARFEGRVGEGAIPELPPLARPRSRRRSRGRLAWPVVGLAIVLAAVVGPRLLRSSPIPEIGASTPATSEEGLQVEPAISRNGRLLAYVAGTPQRLKVFVRRLDGGVPWRLTPDSGTSELQPRWSPDNDAIAYLSGGAAYLAPAVGGEPRLLASGGVGEDAGVRSVAWSPAGDSLAIVRHDSLLVIPREGRGSRLVGRGTQVHSCAWSPVGEWIACVSGNWIARVPGTLFGNRAPSAIVVFPAAGGTALELTDHEHEHRSPEWAPDGRSLWMVADLDGERGAVYAMAFGADGRPGPLVRRPLVAGSISLAAGKLAYSVPQRRANVWSVPIDAGPVRTTLQAARVTSGNQLVEVLSASRDGRWLVYDSDLHGNPDIYRVSTVGGAPERLTSDPRPEFAGDLAPDGQSLAYHLWVDGVRRLQVRDLASGVTREIVPTAGDQGVPRWSPDGTALAVWEHGSEPGSVFVVQRGAQGEWGAPRWRVSDAQLPAWAPDGRTLTVLDPDGSIDVVSDDGGSRTTIYRPRAGSDDPLATYVARDARHSTIWFLGHRPSGAPGIWSIPEAGGASHLEVDLRDALGRINGPTMASDGERLYFTLEERLSNVRWAELLQP